jgi:hypothetical protein
MRSFYAPHDQLNCTPVCLSHRYEDITTFSSAVVTICATRFNTKNSAFCSHSKNISQYTSQHSVWFSEQSPLPVCVHYGHARLSCDRGTCQGTLRGISGLLVSPTDLHNSERVFFFFCINVTRLNTFYEMIKSAQALTCQICNSKHTVPHYTRFRTALPKLSLQARPVYQQLTNPQKRTERMTRANIDTDMQQLQTDETRSVVRMPWHLHVPPTRDERKVGRNLPSGYPGAWVGYGPVPAPEGRQRFGYRNAVFFSHTRWW